MATGTTTLLWYLACCGFVGFTLVVGGALVLYGERKRRKRRKGLEKDSGGAP